MDMPPPFDALWFQMSAGLLVGLALGSFTTMLSYRLPRHISIIKPRSHCPSCKHGLTPRELVPVVSWALQRGACRHCGAFTGWRYPLIEIVTGVACMIAFALMGFTSLLILPITVIVAMVTWVAIRLEK